MSPRFLSILPLLLSCLAYEALGQNNNNPQTASGYLEQRNNVYKGTILPDFMATTTEGVPFTNASIRNRATLFVFWYPTCGCFKFKELDTVAQAFANRKDFQIIAVGADTGGLARYRSTAYMPYKYITVGTEAKMHEMNFGNGFPTLMLVDKNGVVAKVEMPIGPLNKARFINMIHDALSY